MLEDTIALMGEETLADAVTLDPAELAGPILLDAAELDVPATLDNAALDESGRLEEPAAPEDVLEDAGALDVAEATRTLELEPDAETIKLAEEAAELEGDNGGLETAEELDSAPEPNADEDGLNVAEDDSDAVALLDAGLELYEGDAGLTADDAELLIELEADAEDDAAPLVMPDDVETPPAEELEGDATTLRRAPLAFPLYCVPLQDDFR